MKKRTFYYVLDVQTDEPPIRAKEDGLGPYSFRPTFDNQPPHPAPVHSAGPDFFYQGMGNQAPQSQMSEDEERAVLNFEVTAQAIADKIKELHQRCGYQGRATGEKEAF